MLYEIETGELYDALVFAAAQLDRWIAWEVDGHYHFCLDAGWTIAISAQSAGRLRIDACHLSVCRSSLWCRVDDRARLADAIEALVEQVCEPV